MYGTMEAYRDLVELAELLEEKKYCVEYRHGKKFVGTYEECCKVENIIEIEGEEIEDE